MGITVGIDLGTTYSAVATFDKASGTTRILKNSFNSDTTPSVVCFDDGSVIIGAEAKDMQAAGNENVASFYKTWMGDPNYSMYFEGREYTSEDMSGVFLRELIKDIESANGVKVDAAVITVPAYFNNEQREATMRAGKKAGLNVLKIINEPTAAIIFYGLSDSQTTKKVMVYDLGGGTFDVTVAEISGSVVQVLGTDGDHQLGGKNWDAVIKDYLTTCFEDEFGVNISRYIDADNELQVESEIIKKKLTQVAKTTATVACEGYTGHYEVTREWFDEATSRVLGKTQFLISQCLADIGENTNGSGIDEVVLVGGSTRMPQVRDMIIREYNKTPITSVDVDTVVARGAAIQAAICTEKTITMSLAGGPSAPKAGGASAPRRTMTLSSNNIKDVTAHSLGMISISDDKSKYVNTIIIPKNTVVPSTMQRPFQIRSRRDNSGEIEVYILQGESLVPSENYILGKYIINGIDPQSEKETVVDISYSYNESGIVDVSAIQRKTGKKLNVTKTAVPDDMSWVDEKPVIQEIKENATIYLVIDVSGSMSNAMNSVKKAARKFVDGMDLTCSKIGVVAFGNEVAKALQPSSNIKEIYRAIDDVTAFRYDIGSGTNGQPLKYLINNFNSQDPKRYVVVLTDGEWWQATAEIASSDILKSKDIQIIALGFADADRAFLQRIASSDEAALKTDLSNMSGAFSSIAQAITEGKEKISLG